MLHTWRMYIVHLSNTTLLSGKFRRYGGNGNSKLATHTPPQWDLLAHSTANSTPPLRPTHHQIGRFGGDAQPTQPLSNPHPGHSAPEWRRGTILFSKKLVPCVDAASGRLFHLPRNAANCDCISNKRLHRPLPKPGEHHSLDHPRSIPARFGLQDPSKIYLFHRFTHLANST